MRQLLCFVLFCYPEIKWRHLPSSNFQTSAKNWGTSSLFPVHIISWRLSLQKASLWRATVAWDEVCNPLQKETPCYLSNLPQTVSWVLPGDRGLGREKAERKGCQDKAIALRGDWKCPLECLYNPDVYVLTRAASHPFCLFSDVAGGERLWQASRSFLCHNCTSAPSASVPSAVEVLDLLPCSLQTRSRGQSMTGAGESEQ